MIVYGLTFFTGISLIALTNAKPLLPKENRFTARDLICYLTFSRCETTFLYVYDLKQNIHRIIH